MPWWVCGQCKESNTEEIICLDYNHSLLTDVPTEVFMFERTLEDLYLDSNRISELPRQLFHCHGLKSLNLSDNEISFIPPAISSYESLQILDISKNSISSLPDTIKSCTRLTHLNLSLNPLEKLPDPVTSILSLVELHLNDVYLEFLPANFGRLVNLKILELRENNLITLPKSMSRLVNLTRLDIGQNDFTELPEVVTSLQNLTELWIDTNRIRRLSPEIGQLRKLVHFDASNNNLEYLPRDIGYWTKVVEFCLSNNELTEIPSTIGNMKNLIGLKLEENQIQSLPDGIGKLVNLEELMLTHNDIRQLPESIGLLRKLQILSVDENFLTSVPSELGSCTSLCILSLRGNSLTSIPAEIGHLSNLRVLNLVGNKLQELPVSLLKLGQLAALWLSDNQSQPLVPLQQEYHLEAGRMFLTCFMLPQIGQKVRPVYSNSDRTSIAQSKSDESFLRGCRRHIYFAPDEGALDRPHRLSRAPTPYPKELRALAKHARSLQRGISLSSCSDQEYRQTESSLQSPQNPIQIKEAKVTQKPNIGFSGVQQLNDYHYQNISQFDDDSVLQTLFDNQSEIYSDKNGTYDKERNAFVYWNKTTPCERVGGEFANLANNSMSDEIDGSQYEKSEEQNTISQKPVIAYKSSPAIREAKYIRTYNAPEKTTNNDPYSSRLSDVQYVGPGPAGDSYQRSSICSSTEIQTIPSQPPPYHIAAAYSLQAKYFNNIKSDIFSNDKKLLTMRVPSELSQITSDTVSIDIPTNSQPKNCDYDNRLSVKDDEKDIEERIKEINNPDTLSDIRNLETPPTFITDIPSVGQNILAPTPQRPAIQNINQDESSDAYSPMNHVDRKSNNSQNHYSPTHSLQGSCQSVQYSDQIQNLNYTHDQSRSSVQSDKYTDRQVTYPPTKNVKLKLNEFKKPPYQLGFTEMNCEIQQDMPQTDYNCEYSRTNKVDKAGNVNEALNSFKNNIINKTPITNEQSQSDNNYNLTADKNNYNAVTNCYKPSTRKGQLKWMFGQHKNATVVQVKIQKTHTLGFTIVEKPNCGFFVSGVEANGPASSNLRLNDKILEVDSFSLNKLKLQEVLEILQNTGPIVNMMISRSS